MRASHCLRSSVLILFTEGLRRVSTVVQSVGVDHAIERHALQIEPRKSGVQVNMSLSSMWLNGGMNQWNISMTISGGRRRMEQYSEFMRISSWRFLWQRL